MPFKLCTSCRKKFFPVLPSQATFIFHPKTSRQPRGPWCAQNKFNICHRIKWLCSPANEKPQTFENCLATLPARKKLSVTPFSRRLSLLACLSHYLSLYLAPSAFYSPWVSFSSCLSLCSFLFTCTLWVRLFWPQRAKQYVLQKEMGDSPLPALPCSVGSLLLSGRIVWITKTWVAFSCK